MSLVCPVNGLDIPNISPINGLDTPNICPINGLDVPIYALNINIQGVFEAWICPMYALHINIQGVFEALIYDLYALNINIQGVFEAYANGGIGLMITVLFFILFYFIFPYTGCI